MFEPDAEALDPKHLRQLQLERLQLQVKRVYESVPFYRRRFDSAGLCPNDLRSLDDLRRLPFTDKGNLRDNYPFGLFAVPTSAITRLHASSGTKGKPTVAGYTTADIDIWARCCARSLIAAGVQPGDVVHNAYGYGMFTGGLGLHYGAEMLGCTVVPASAGNTPRQILLLQDFAARVLCCTPSFALNIAAVMAENGIGRDTLALQIGIFGAEPWTEETRATVEHALRIKAYDIYGLSEVLGPGVSMECAEGRDGLHIWEDHFLPEIVDPESGEVLPDGRFGELVLTTLTKEAMPLIRFRTGDISALFPEPCRCGRTHRRMARVSGRTDNMLIVRGVNIFPSEIERVLRATPGIAPLYHVVVDRRGTLDALEVQVEVSPEFTSGAADLGALIALRDRLNDALDAALGLSTEVVIHPPDSLPRVEGKAMRIQDRRTL